MSNEATAPVMYGPATSPSTIVDIVSIAEQIISSGVEQIAFVTAQLCYEREDLLKLIKKS